MSFLLSLGALLAGSAWAQEPVSVFVAPFGSSEDAAAISEMLPSLLADRIDAHPAMRVVYLEQVGRIHDVPAEVYAASCPPGQDAGCAFVIGEAAGVDFAVAGAVARSGSDLQVRIHIIDIVAAAEAMSFQAGLGAGDDAVFAEGVARVLAALALGEAGHGTDIRRSGTDDTVDLEAEERVLAARELDELSGEIGDVSTLSVRQGLDMDRPRITMDELTSDIHATGETPWMRLGMTPEEYVRYHNSGVGIHEWRRRKRGRNMQLLIRGSGGFGMGPWDGSYNAQFGLSEIDLSTKEQYAWQGVSRSLAPVGELGIAFGVLPTVDIGVHGGVARGIYTLQTHTVTEGRISNPLPAEETGNRNWYAGGQVQWVPLPTIGVRPVVGVRGGWQGGTAVDDHLDAELNAALLETLPIFAAPYSFSVAGVLGGEISMAERVDLFVHVPVGMTIGGDTSVLLHEGGGVLTDLTDPPELEPIGFQVLLGLQGRLLSGEKKVGIDDYVD